MTTRTSSDKPGGDSRALDNWADAHRVKDADRSRPTVRKTWFNSSWRRLFNSRGANAFDKKACFPLSKTIGYEVWT